MSVMDFDRRFPNRDLVTHAIRCPSSSGDTTLPRPGLVLGGAAAVARVDHSRWIADCPFCPGGAEFVSADRPFFCSECRNASTGHVPVPTVFPGELLRGQIDAYLSARPVPAHRNWSPGESVADLRAENRAHGVRLPKERG